MKKALQISKLGLEGILGCLAAFFLVLFPGWLQDNGTIGSWVELARVFGIGTIGLAFLWLTIKLVQAIKGGGQKQTTDLIGAIQHLDATLALMNTATQSAHDRMLKHDEDMFKRLEALSAIENQAIANHGIIMGNQGNIIKQLDRMENKQ